MRNCEIGDDPKRMVDYLIDCTLATVEVMASRNACPKRGEFYRQCAIAQAGIDFLGVSYPFKSRAKEFVGKETAFEYYTRQHKEILGGYTDG